MEHAILLRYVLERQSRPEWEELVRKGHWAIRGRTEGISGEVLRRFDTIRGEFVETPASILWERVSEHFRTYQTVPTTWELEREVEDSYKDGLIPPEEAQSLRSFLAEVAAVDPRPESWAWVMTRAQEEIRQQAITQKLYRAAGVLHTDVEQAAAILREPDPFTRPAPLIRLSEASLSRWDAYQGAREGLGRGVTTGFRAADYRMGTLYPGEVLVVVGRTSKGKSWIVTEIARSNFLQGKTVLFYTGEMQYTVYLARMEGLSIGVDPRLIRGGTLGTNEADYRLLLQQWGEHPPGEIVFLDRTPQMRVRDLGDHVKRVEEELQRPVDLVVIDPIYKLRPNKDTRSENWESMARVAIDVKALAMELPIPIVATHQQNRGAAATPDDVGAGMKYADAIADEVDHIWKVRTLQDENWEIENLKNRTGENGWTFTLLVDLNRGVILEPRNDLEPEHG